MTGPALRLRGRDLAIAESLQRYGYLATDQLRQLHWPHGTASYARRRLAKLTATDMIDRRRPPRPDDGGSLDYIYRLGPQGERALDAGRLRSRHQWPNVAHLLERVYLAELALTVRDAAGPDARWLGPQETAFTPDPQVLASDVHDLVLDELRPVLPDAAIVTAQWSARVLLLEVDGAQRPQWQIEKLRRYDALICSWPRIYPDTPLPVAVFACRDGGQLEQLLAIAATELRGRRTRAAGRHSWPGRERVLFALADDLARGQLVGLRLTRGPLRRGAQPPSAPAANAVRLIPDAQPGVVMNRLGPAWARPEPTEIEDAA